jgi:hypothetical protein
MTMNDLTAPLGQGPRPYRRAIEVSAAQIIAVALGLFFGAFVLWAVTAEDRAGGEPVAVAPADLRIAKRRRRSSRCRKPPPQPSPRSPR